LRNFQCQERELHTEIPRDFFITCLLFFDHQGRLQVCGPNDRLRMGILLPETKA